MDSEVEPSREHELGHVIALARALAQSFLARAPLRASPWTYRASLRADARGDLAGRPSTSTATRISDRRAATVTDTMTMMGLKSTLGRQLLSVDRRPRNDAFQGKMSACSMTYLSTVGRR